MCTPWRMSGNLTEVMFTHLSRSPSSTKKLYLGMKKGAFKPRNDEDLAWFIKYNMKKEQVDLKGIDVFKFLADLAFENALLS